MEYNPPIATRTTKELLEIVENKEDWQMDAVLFAQQELEIRGISTKQQETITKSISKRKQRILTIKSRATYTAVEKLLIVLLGPFIFAFTTDLFIFQEGDGFKKKNRQGVFYLVLGLLLYALVIYFSIEISKK